MYGMQTQVTCGGSSCSTVDYARALAHWAKIELLKEKVKQRMEASYGKQLDKTADLIVEVLSERMKNAEELEKKEGELEQAFENFESVD